MNLKLGYLFVLGAALVVGWLIGLALAKRAVGRFWIRGLSLAGAAAYLIGQVEADYDHRFRLLAIGGGCLMTAGIVFSVRYKRTLKERSVELWALPKPR